ncbi:hypothetical protein [Novipirellula maiorica]|nr:hypothetical protein [Rhodopirellula maiorica]
MRQLCLGTCMLALALTNVGCRQTTGPTAGGPLTPVGPMAPVGLTPAPIGGVGTSSAISPLGASTRVPPPPNNSFQNANGATAGFVPYGQTNVAPFQSPGQAQPFDSFSSNPSQFPPSRSSGLQPTAPPQLAQVSGSGYEDQAIGSGVATTGWQETRSQINTVSGTFANPVNGNPAAGYQPANSVPRVRFNGMQVHDLTGAPKTPYSVAPATTYVAPMQSNTMNTLSRGYYPPAVDNGNRINLAPQRAPAEYQTNPQYNPQPIPIPERDHNANAPGMVPHSPNAASSQYGSGGDQFSSADNVASSQSAPALHPAPQLDQAATTVNAFEQQNRQLAEHQPYTNMEPAFQGARRFTTPMPSTDPLNQPAAQTAENANTLRWGRPGTAF